jgi:hypothetical protein
VSRRALAPAGAAVLALAAIGLVWDHARFDALSADEPVHILSGYFEVSGRTAIVNIEHPPLAKILAGLSLATLDLPPAPAKVPLGSGFTDFGHAFLFENRVSPDAIAAAARRPFRWLLGALVVLVFVAGCGRYGPAPALCASALVAFDPNFVAHAGVVHTDVAASLGFLATVVAWNGAQEKPSARRLALVALALGATLATKFSGVYLLPILALQALLAARRSERPGRDTLRNLGRLAIVAAGALVVVFAVFAAVTTRMNGADQRQIIWESVGERGAPGLARAIQRVAEISPPLGHYLGGLAYVARQNAEGGGINFLAGKTAITGFPGYFLVAFLVKSSLAFLAATALALGGAAAFRLGRDAALWLLPAAVLFIASAGSSYNIGVRHLLPAYPFLALGAAAVLARLAAAGRRRAAVAAVLLSALPLSAAGETLRIHPYELSYFNPLAGGPEGGRKLLTDSNVDWGLDLRRLAVELRRRGVKDPTVVYFGGDDVPYRVGVPDFSADPRVRGTFVAVSAFHLAVGPLYYAYHGATGVAASLENLLRDLAARGRPAGRVGYSMYLFELPPREPPTK